MRRWVPIILQGLVVGLLLLLPVQSPDSAPSPTVGFVGLDVPGHAGGRTTEGQWREMPLADVPAPASVAWLDWTPSLRAPDSGQPMAVALSGPFSAQVFLNGTKIGEKGVPGPDASTERAGPIDAVFPLPAAYLRAGENRIAVRFSAHRVGYRPFAIVQSLRLTPVTTDARRDIRYYAPGLLFGGGLVALAAGLLLLMRARKDRRLRDLLFGVIGLAGAFAAEVSRALTSYPYDWHQARQLAIGAGVLAFNILLLRFVLSRWPGRLRETRAVLVLGLVMATGACLLLPGYDAKITVASLFLHSLAVAWVVWRGARGDQAALLFSLLLASFPVLVSFQQLAGVSISSYLDLSVYILAVSALGGLLFFAPDILSPPTLRPPEIHTIGLRTTGRTVFVLTSDIVLLKAVGNYTEVHRQAGRRVLDQRGLGTLLESLPGSFLRIHRSYAVNLTAVVSLISEEGSRYFLELKTGDRPPVSRAQVKELRARLASGTSLRPSGES